MQSQQTSGIFQIVLTAIVSAITVWLSFSFAGAVPFNRKSVPEVAPGTCPAGCHDDCPCKPDDTVPSAEENQLRSRDAKPFSQIAPHRIVYRYEFSGGRLDGKVYEDIIASPGPLVGLEVTSRAHRRIAGYRIAGVRTLPKHVVVTMYAGRGVGDAGPGDAAEVGAAGPIIGQDSPNEEGSDE